MRRGAAAWVTWVTTRAGWRWVGITLLRGTMYLSLVLMLSELTLRVIQKLKYDYGLLSKPRRELVPFFVNGFVPYFHAKGEARIRSRHGETYPLKKPSGTYRIVCFGDSTVESLRNFHLSRLHYPGLVQQQMRRVMPDRAIEVINVGYQGHTTAHALVMLALHVQSWEPDLIFLTGNFNDLSATWFPHLTLDYSNLLTQPFYLPTLEPGPLDLLRHSSRLWQAIEKKAKRPSSLRRRSYGSAPSELAQAIYRRNLATFARMAQELGAETVFLTQPLHRDEQRFVEFMKWHPYSANAEFPLHEEFLLHHARFNDLMKETAREYGARSLDLAALIRDDEHFFDFVHYTDEGLRRVAAEIGRFLVQEVELGRRRTGQPRYVGSASGGTSP